MSALARALVSVACVALTACSGAAVSPDPAPTPSAAPSSIVPPASAPAASTPAPTALDAADAGSAPPVTTPPPPTCTINTGSVSCDQCSMQSCCPEISACDADPECSVVDACVAKCFQTYGRSQPIEGQCEAQCMAAHPTGGQKLAGLYQCMRGSCASACPD